MREHNNNKTKSRKPTNYGPCDNCETFIKKTNPTQESSESHRKKEQQLQINPLKVRCSQKHEATKNKLTLYIQ